MFSGISNSDEFIYVNNQKAMIRIAKNSMTSPILDIENLYDVGFEGYNILVFHPGYVDAYILAHLSINTQRVYDVATLISDEFSSFIQNNSIKLITYKDIK